jgi:hypothetical protein
MNAENITPLTSNIDGFPVGENVIVRTVTMIYTGRLIDVTPNTLILSECSWIPETDRYSKFVREGAVRECEPYPDDLPVFINRGALLDLCVLQAPLPRTLK